MMTFMSDTQNIQNDPQVEGTASVQASPIGHAAFTIADVEKLSALSRLALTTEEKAQFSTDIGGILSYVSQIQEVAGDATILDARLKTDHYTHKNHMRDDIATTGTGSELNPDTMLLVDSAPEHTDGYVQVKKIL
jgi:aspartyl/glutamyl-tRNA(Asn/Gln) amidotransferase C subunit